MVSVNSSYFISNIKHVEQLNYFFDITINMYMYIERERKKQRSYAIVEHVTELEFRSKRARERENID